MSLRAAKVFVQQRVLPLAVVLGTGARLPLAPLFLGRLYRMLDFVSNDEKEGAGCYGITSSACVTFLQVFIWERFKGSAVEPVTPEFLHKLERGRRSHSIVEFPLCCKWFRRRANKDAFKPAVLDDIDEFIFRPYSSISGFEAFHFYYPEDQSWACPGLTAMFLTATLRYIPTYGDRFEPLVVRYSPHRVRRQFGINQDVPVGGFVCRAPKAVIVSFIKHDGNSRKGMFSNCLGTKNSVGVPTPEYNKFWEFQLHKFDKFIGTGGTMLRCPESANKNKRLIPRKTLMGKMSKLNLSYVEVYSNGMERVVGDSGKSASQSSSRVTTTRVRTGNNSGSKKPIRTSKDGEKKDNRKVHHFKSKTSRDHITFTSASGVRMILSPNALPLKKGMKETEKGVKRKFVSGSKTSCVPSERKAKRKAIMRDPSVGRKRSSSDDSYNESERCDSSDYEEEFNEGDHEDIQVVQSGDDRARWEVQSDDEDSAELDIQSDENSVGLEVQSGTRSEVQSGSVGLEVQSEGAGLEVQSDEGGVGLEVQSEGGGLEVQSGGAGLEVQSGGAGLEVQSGGAGLEVQSGCAGLEVQSGGAGLEVQSGGAGLEVQSGGADWRSNLEVLDWRSNLEVRDWRSNLEVRDWRSNLEVLDWRSNLKMNLPIDLSQDHRYSFTHGFASFCGRPGGFSLSPAVTSQEVDNSIDEWRDFEENLCSNVTDPLAGGSWEVRFNDFMARFESTDRSSTTFDDIAPSLSGSQSLFEGRKVPSEFVLPLTSLAAKYSGGNLSSLFKEDNSLHQRHILTKELGYVLFSMEHEVETEESFLVWRDMCRDMMNWGFKLEFMLDHLKRAARNFFGYLLRPVGSENCCTEVCRLEEAVLESKKKLSNLENQLGKAKEEFHSKLGGAISSDTLVCILRSSWTSQSRAIHGLY
ncbi:hypothetical protein M0R45_002624 [Rubus argutus]|uniref:Aminotransferase-like plant mobile domain-containing protein n=1 Tax=Rubus argutus TaxID=59490 RepID=A0AAW1VQC6_RUBAR